MPSKRPTSLFLLVEMGVFAAVVVGAVLRASDADWDPALFGLLLAFAAFSDLTAIETKSKLKTSGSFLALVLAMVLLGGAPAAVIGVLTILLGWLRWRDAPHSLLNTLLTYAAFPLIGGIFFHEISSVAQIAPSDLFSYSLVFAT